MAKIPKLQEKYKGYFQPYLEERAAWGQVKNLNCVKIKK